MEKRHAHVDQLVLLIPLAETKLGQQLAGVGVRALPCAALRERVERIAVARHERVDADEDHGPPDAILMHRIPDLLALLL